MAALSGARSRDQDRGHSDAVPLIIKTTQTNAKQRGCFYLDSPIRLEFDDCILLQAISLYRNLFRYGKKFSNYNFREYVLRRTREDFRVYRSVTDPSKVSELLDNGRKDLEVVKRQATLSSIFSPQAQYVVELRK